MLFQKSLSLVLSALIAFSSLALEAQECSNYLSNTYTITQNYNFLIHSGLVRPKTWGGDLAFLATHGHLISQSDELLAAQGLLVENGGLCGPTCVAYLIASKDFFESQRQSLYWVDNTDTIILKLLNNYQIVALGQNNPTGHDPRLGTHLELYTSRFNTQNSEWGFYSRQLDPESVGQMNYHLNTLNGLIVITAEFNKQPANRPASRHALVVLGIQTEDQLITLIDPNSPWSVLVTKYEVKNHKIHFTLDQNLYGAQGHSDVFIHFATSFTIK